MSDSTDHRTLKDGRVSTGSHGLYLSKIPEVDLTTTRHLTDEYFASLQYYSEIEEVGLELVRGFGYENSDEQKRVFRLFQAFIRQGKSFYDAAEILEYRASPLLYYYSFLNLAKAYLCLSAPGTVEGKIMHGLTHIHAETDFQSQTACVTSGVFPIFYEALTGYKIREKLELNISNLFGYILDINYEYQKVNYGESRFIIGLSRVVADERIKDAKKVWPLLAVSDLDGMKNYSKFFQSFFDYFEEVNLHKDYARIIFDIKAAEKKAYNFLQSKTEYDLNSPTYEEQIREDCLSFMKDYCKPVSMKSLFDFFIFLPLNDENQIPFNDTLATYVVMFYLGSLVRYNPSYLEGLLNSKHAWIIESFTKQVGVVFLRNICSLIIKENLVYTTI